LHGSTIRPHSLNSSDAGTFGGAALEFLATWTKTIGAFARLFRMGKLTVPPGKRATALLARNKRPPGSGKKHLPKRSAARIWPTSGPSPGIGQPGTCLFHTPADASLRASPVIYQETAPFAPAAQAWRKKKFSLLAILPGARRGS